MVMLTICCCCNATCRSWRLLGYWREQALGREYVSTQLGSSNSLKLGAIADVCLSSLDSIRKLGFQSLRDEFHVDRG
jgi:hypothetical protein